MQETSNATQQTSPALVGIQACLEAVFPDEGSRPSFRTFVEWKNNGYFPQVKIGARVFLDPEQVRASLIEKFTVSKNDELRAN